MKLLIRIRRAVIADAPALATIGAETFAETFAADNSREDVAAYLDANFRPNIQAKEVADPSTVTFLAEVSDAGDRASSWSSAGYAKLHAGETPECVSGPAPLELARLYVAAAYHGQRVGAALMSACLDAARDRAARTMWLGVWERNTRAIAFYRGFGFKHCGEHTFMLGSDPQRDLIMVRSVD